MYAGRVKGSRRTMRSRGAAAAVATAPGDCEAGVKSSVCDETISRFSSSLAGVGEYAGERGEKSRLRLR
jgi:hypothetical protein